MSRRRASAGSIFWGVTLVAVGGLLLARNLGYSIPIWGPLVRYWPVLIIGWGVLKLVDYYRLRNDPDHRPIFTGGEVAMLIFAIFIGSAMTAAANIGNGSIFGGPATIQSDNTFTQTASNWNDTENYKGYSVFYPVCGLPV